MHGYDVFRPWSLKPAPVPDTCSTPNVAAQEVVPRPRVALPRARQGGDDRPVDPRAADQGLQAHRRRALHARRLRPVTLFESTQHAREWISAEVNRRLFAWFIDHRRRPRRQAAAPAERGLVHPDDEPGRLRLHLHVARDAPVAQEPARRQRRRRDRPRQRRRRPRTATGPRSGTTTSRAPPTTRRRRPTTARARLGARGPGRRAAASAPQAEVPHRLPLLRAAHPLPGGLAGRDRGHRRAADEGAGRRRRPSGRRGVRPRRLGRAVHHQRRRDGRRLQQLGHAGLHRRARRRYG